MSRAGRTEPQLCAAQMRVRLSALLGVTALACGSLLLLTAVPWSHCPPAPASPASSVPAPLTQPIDCLINSEATVACLRHQDDVYVPFSFLKKYFEVYGRVVTEDGKDRLDWQHSYSRVFRPKEPYDPSAKYLWLESYNVEVRDRVKCISGAEGVPISLQWDSGGHIYPIQVAQYGLSHFSKNLTEGPPSVVPLSHWSPTSQLVTLSTSSDGTLHFATPLEEEGQQFLMFQPENSLAESTLVALLKLTNGSLTAILEPGGYQLRYSAGLGVEPMVRGRLVEYRLGAGGWLVRDLAVDLQKGVRGRRLAQLRRLRVRRLELRGHGTLSTASLRSTAHGLQFLQAARWLLHNQDKMGGWPIMVPRRLSGGLLQLPRGWYSAMAQGQAISLLTRAYGHTEEPVYLQAALSALHLFSVPSSQHGVRALFMDKFPWFEEYPTTPASFVLNGFIFALFGLYDLSTLCGQQRALCGEDPEQAARLFSEGLVSLRHMLLLFDTGSGTVYDLRHIQLGTPPNRARWDYHSTHINQLLWLATIDPREPLWRSTANRWASYMRGHRSAHN